MAAGTMDVEITTQRLDELMRWHGTDEGNLPPPHTLEHLSRDTVAALAQLQEAREGLLALRAAMGRAFWARDPRELRAIVLDALGPPPIPAASAGDAHPAESTGVNGIGARAHGNRPARKGNGAGGKSEATAGSRSSRRSGRTP